MSWAVWRYADVFVCSDEKGRRGCEAEDSETPERTRLDFASAKVDDGMHCVRDISRELWALLYVSVPFARQRSSTEEFLSQNGGLGAV